MVTKKKCGICKEEFEAVYPNNKYCSPECVKKANCLKSKRWRDKNPEKVKEMCKRYYNEDPQRAREMYRNWVKRNRDKLRSRLRKSYHKNKEKRVVNARDWKLIEKKECENCGSKDELEIHHTSYKPSITKVLCRKCHLKEHGKVYRGRKKTC